MKYHLNARAAEILAHTVDSCFETTNMMYATSGEVGVKNTMEKHNSSFRAAEKGLQYLSPLFSKAIL